MRAELFEPLKMASCGSGPPGADGSGAPWGHAADGTPVDPTTSDTEVVRLPLFGPAGGVHCSMADWATFLSELVRGLDGRSDYLQKETVERLLTPADAPFERDPNAWYALGWSVHDSPAGAIYAHDGSNGLWYASALLRPGADRG